MRQVHTRNYNTILAIVALGISLLFTGLLNAYAQSDQTTEQKQDTSLRWDSPELRFITEGDYPPFNYYDEDGALTGFNVDLARAICLEMEVRCEIQVKGWNDLIPALDRNETDAVIASLAINRKNIQQVDFTNRYFKMHARFATRANEKLDAPTPENLSRYTIGVLAGTAHEAYLKDFFVYSTVKPFKTAGELYQALRQKDVDLAFGDGIMLMFWLNGTNSGGCCRFLGGSFTEARYFGEGVAIAVVKDNKKLRAILNKALAKIKKSGRYEELILRYFPLGL